MWLEEPRLLEPGLYLPALSPQYMSQKLLLIIQSDRVNIHVALFQEKWEIPIYVIYFKSIMRVNHEYPVFSRPLGSSTSITTRFNNRSKDPAKNGPPLVWGTKMATLESLNPLQSCTRNPRIRCKEFSADWTVTNNPCQLQLYQNATVRSRMSPGTRCTTEMRWLTSFDHISKSSWITLKLSTSSCRSTQRWTATSWNSCPHFTRKSKTLWRCMRCAIRHLRIRKGQGRAHRRSSIVLVQL